MSRIEITVFPKDGEGISRIGDFGDYCLNVSRIRGVECRLTENGTVIEGDTATLLEILHELDNSSFIIGAKRRVVVILRIDENKSEHPPK
ncbi:MAG TPA: thiamine-binding protein [Thermodesulfobacteriota bacterium]|nr:thiamine-binding protein [Thermodesulfobacteriota bacterium]